MSWVWCNGEWTKGDGIGISHRDRGWSHGLGLFETLLAVDGRPWFQDRHLARLEASAARFGWRICTQDVADALPSLLDKNGLMSGRARVRIAISGGRGPLQEPGNVDGQVIWISASSAGEAPDSYSVGISRWKKNECSPLTGHKCASYAENLFLLEEARRNGWDEVLVSNHAGFLCESAMANLFVQIGDRLLTPPLSSGCLPGVTRGVLLELAGSCGLRPAEEDLSEPDLWQADGIYLSSAVRGVVAVREIAGRSVSIPPMASILRNAWESAGRSGAM